MATFSMLDVFDSQNSTRRFQLIDNYIYLHHTNEFVILPVYPQTVSDSQQANFQSSTILMRSAPIASYSNSQARTVSFQFDLHREYMTQINYQKSNLNVEMGDDYVDTIIKRLQACAVPNYNDGEKMVDPPLVSVRIGDDIFIKGYISGGPSITYEVPIIRIGGKDRYAKVSIGNLTITEVEPYSATEIAKYGSYRGLSTSLTRNLWKPSGSLIRDNNYANNSTGSFNANGYGGGSSRSVNMTR